MNDEEKGMVSSDTVEGSDGQATPEVVAPPKKAKISHDELKARNLVSQNKTRARKKKAEAAAYGRYNNPEELPLKRVDELLDARQITTTCVQDAATRFGPSTATGLGIVANEYYWKHGPAALLARKDGSDQKDVDVEAPTNDVPKGELLFRPELKALYEYCALGREIIGKQLSFEEWLDARFKARTDLWFLSFDVCGKALVESTHREMVDFFVKKDPTILSAIVAEKGSYDLEDQRAAVLQQDTQHDRLLLFPRGFFKSTINIVDLVQWILNFPSITALVLTATLPLGRAFLSELTSYFKVRSVTRPSNLAMLFPEFTISASDGSETTFKCPASLVAQKEPTVWNSAIDAESTGFHQLLQIIDDGVSKQNSDTPESREKLWTKVTLLDELLNRPEGFRTFVGTRYAGGESPDVYGRLIQQNDNADEVETATTGGLKVLVKPAWTVLPHAIDKKITDLTAEDVDLLFPFAKDGSEGKGSFRVLRKKLLSNETVFRQQQLNEACDGIGEDLSLRLQFDRDMLTRSVVLPGAAPQQGEVIASVDVAYSLNKWADRSVVSICRLYQNDAGQKSICVLWQEAGRFRGSELAHHIVMLTKKYNPRTVLIERSPTWDLTASAIRDAERKYRTNVPIFWAPINQQKNAKQLRLKQLEILLGQNRLTFVSGPWVNDFFDELMKLNERKPTSSTSSIHDDRADSLSLAQKFFVPSLGEQGQAEDSASDLRARDEAMQQARLKMYQQHMFGVSQPFRAEPKEVEPEQESNPFFRGIGQHLRRN